MNKRAFTLIELLAVVVILAIVSGLAVISMNGVIGTGKKGVYKNLEDTLKGAAQNYLIDNPDKIPLANSDKILKAKDLVGYFDELKSPDGGDCNNSNDTKNSFVKVTRGENISNNFNLTYEPCLICFNSSGAEVYRTTGC